MNVEALPIDFVDLLEAFVGHEVEFLVVGAFALAAHGVSRSTGDLDVWVNPSAPNATRVWRALAEFGAPLEEHSMSVADFSRAGTVYQMGLPPLRVDILTAPSGIDFPDAWSARAEARFGELRVPVLGLAHLVQNKRAAGRAKDRADLALLAEAGLIPGETATRSGPKLTSS